MQFTITNCNRQTLHWRRQKEFYTRAVSFLPINLNISPKVGKVFGIKGRLDFYVNGDKRWGIDLIRES